MREHHATRLRCSAGGKDNLGGVITRERNGRINISRKMGQRFPEIFQFKMRPCCGCIC